MNRERDIAGLIAEFIAHGEAATKAWRKLGVSEFNQNVEGMGQVVEKMKSLCPDTLHQLVPLMDYRDPYVRLYAAYYCLDFDRIKSVQKIRELATSGNIARVSAFTMLRYLGEG
jgi:hypothetical protein